LSVTAQNPEQAKAAGKKFAVRVGSEGFIAKRSSGIYPLTGGAIKNWIKFRTESDIMAQVVAKIPIKGTKAAWKYMLAIRDQRGKLVPIGTSFNTSLNVKIGDILRITFGNINKWTDPDTGRIWYGTVFPRVMEPADQDRPSTTRKADEENRASHGEVGQKRFPKEFEGILESMSEAAKGCLSHAEGMRKTKLDPKSYPTGFYRIFTHFRLKSAHLDLRYKVDDHLEGWTLNAQPAGVIKAPVMTVEDGYRTQSAVRWKLRPDMESTSHVVAERKGTQPVGWINVFNKVIEPGGVGATAEGPGVFVLCDEGHLTMGVQKPDFKEYFLDGEIYKGRAGFRLVSTKGFEGDQKQREQWQASFNMQDQTPNILSRTERSRKRDFQYVPKEGEKCVPPEWEKKIKSDLQWWVKGLKPGQRLDRLHDAFNDLVERGLLKHRPLKEVHRQFLLRRFFWKGQTVVRGIAGSYWYSIIWKQGDGIREIRLADKTDLPTKDKIVSAELGEVKVSPPGEHGPSAWFSWPSDKPIPPNHSLNPNKKIDMFTERVDEGEIHIVHETEQKLEIVFRGKVLRGGYLLKRPDEKTEQWDFGPEKVKETCNG
jgi:hypothetical protein